MYKLCKCSGYILWFFLFIATFSKSTFAQDEGTWERLIPPTEAVNVVITTPYGLFAGQNSTDGYPGSYNGVFKSFDLGQTWEWTGLMRRGISDLAYKDGAIYACTYYTKDGSVGVFKSTNRGESWEHVGPNLACTKIAAAQDSLIFGTRYDGVWLSSDNGLNFEQTLPINGTDRDVLGLSCENFLCFAGTYLYAYRSEDGGKSWEEITELGGKSPGGFAFYKDTILAGTKNGLYKSANKGLDWDICNSWGTSQIGKVIFYQSVAYVSKKDSNNKWQVYKSKDSGQTWENTNIDVAYNTPPISGLTGVYSHPSYVFASGSGIGIRRYAIPIKATVTFPFLGPLWNNSSSATRLQSITSYFDHSYPLLGYCCHQEPQNERSTTLNFMGMKQEPPFLYYSSHDGYDFGLPYGTELLAPASGKASYQYSALGGHIIKIDHQNGYQTSYLHLQKDGLVNNNSNPIWVDKGQKIGLVGLTGNTSGPHLHFSINYDKNHDGNFNDNYADGKTDPYSWQNSMLEDPWEYYSWTDWLGNHTGMISQLLWEDMFEITQETVTQNQSLILQNGLLTIELLENNLIGPATLFISPAMGVNTAFLEKSRKYVSASIYAISVIDQMGQEIKNLVTPIKIGYILSEDLLSNIDAQTLAINFFDPDALVWRNIVSTWDPITKKLEAFSNHLSEFMATGQKLDEEAPQTSLEITGQKDEKWFVEYPMLKLVGLDNIDTTIEGVLYSLDDGITWNNYITQTQIIKEGVYAILFRSLDFGGNLEEVKESPLIFVDTAQKYKDESVLKEGTFRISYL